VSETVKIDGVRPRAAIRLAGRLEPVPTGEERDGAVRHRDGGRDKPTIQGGGSGPTGTVARLPKTLRWAALTAVAGFNAVSAVGGAVAIFLTDGLGMPKSFLTGSPFDSFFVPALILLVIVGGSQVLAALLLLLRRSSSLVWTAFAGFTMVTWILVETVIIRGFGVLQALYYLSGVVELVLVLALLGIVAWLPRNEPDRRAESALPDHG
jgi:hypothetical protein